MQTLEEKLGYHFQNIALLENALTHSCSLLSSPAALCSLA